MNNKFLALAATAVIVAPVVSALPTAATTTFPDIQAGTELHDAVMALVEREVISGYPDGSYQPNKGITRAEAAKILTGALNLQPKNVSTPYYQDVPKDHKFAPYIYTLAENGVLNKNDKNYAPDEIVTRSQMAEMLSKAFQLTQSVAIPFTDVVKEQDKKYISALFASGVTKGISNTKFGVNNPVTRGQMAVFIVRAEQLAPPSTTVVQKTTAQNIPSLLVSTSNVIQFDPKQFHEKLITGEAISYFSDTDLTTERPLNETSWIQFKASEPGTAYISLAATHLNARIKDIALFSYRLDITKQGEDFHITATLLDKIVSEPVKVDLPNGYDNAVLLQEDLTPVLEQDYKIETIDGKQQMVIFTQQPTLRIHKYGLPDILVNQAVLMWKIYSKTETIYSNQGILLRESLFSPTIKSATVVDDGSTPILDVAIVNGDLQLTFKQAGTEYLHLIDENDKEYIITLKVQKMDTGYRFYVWEYKEL